MAWTGDKIKIIAKERKITLIGLSRSLNVSRQTVNAWVNGQIPRGHHLVNLSKELLVPPSYFFSDEPVQSISIPLHRTRGVAKINRAMEDEALQLASKYEDLFKDAPDPGLVKVLRIKDRNTENAILLAKKLRNLCHIERGKPLDYQRTFLLLSQLNIVAIFCKFPVKIKSYAFYCRIHDHRVVFINTQTNVLDLIFPILHEMVHAICDEGGDVIYDPADEGFCDEVANYIQFPKAYVKLVASSIANRRAGIQINMLKEFARTNGHALYGICKEIKKRNPAFKLKIGGADSNLKKEFHSIGDILFEKREARDFIDWLKALSPNYIKILVSQVDAASKRRIAEWLDLTSSLDGNLVIHELKRLKTPKD